MLRATIGMKNYSGTACTFNFEKSVCILPEGVDRSHFKVRQLLALFPGTVIEDVGVGTAVEKKPEPESTVGAADQQIKADFEATVETDHAARAPVEEEVAEEVETEVAEEEAEEVEDPEVTIQRLVDEKSRKELVEIADACGATYSSRATKSDIAREIVEAQANAG